jgi:hypothetical protein
MRLLIQCGSLIQCSAAPYTVWPLIQSDRLIQCGPLIQCGRRNSVCGPLVQCGRLYTVGRYTLWAVIHWGRYTLRAVIHCGPLYAAGPLYTAGRYTVRPLMRPLIQCGRLYSAAAYTVRPLIQWAAYTVVAGFTGRRALASASMDRSPFR